MTMPANTGRPSGPWQGLLSGHDVRLVAFAMAAVAGLSLATLPGWDTAALSCVLALIMALIAVNDARHFIVPDILSLPAIPLGLLAAGLVSPPDIVWQTILVHAGAMVLAGAGLFLVRIAYRRLRGFEGLGLGDVKLVAAGGAWVGMDGTGFFMLLACAGALAFVVLGNFTKSGRIDRHTPIPFGAFLAPAIWCVWFAQNL